MALVEVHQELARLRIAAKDMAYKTQKDKERSRRSNKVDAENKATIQNFRRPRRKWKALT